MAVFKPKYRDRKTGELVESKVWWYKFTYNGEPIRESAKSTRKTIAQEAEKNRRLELERHNAGLPPKRRESRVRSVAKIVKEYSTRYKTDHHGREQSILFSKGRLAHVTRLLGSALVADLTEDRIRQYIETRIQEGAGGRTINMEIGELSRAIGVKWSVLWPKVRKQEERTDAGKALSADEEKRLLDAARQEKRWKLADTMIRIALLTGMRSGEITRLTWGQVDFEKRALTVGRAKTSSGTGRMIPMNADLFAVFSEHADWFTKKFGAAKPGHYLFPFGKPQPTDPTKPTTTLKTVWGSIRKEAKVSCRLHDLRHTALTKLAEAGTPESTMLALAGHMSRAMLERYSHIRMAAKRDAVEALSLSPKPTPAESNGVVQESVQVAVPPKIN